MLQTKQSELKVWNRAVYWPEHLPKTVMINTGSLRLTRHAAKRLLEKGIELPSGSMEAAVIEQDENGKRVLRLPQGDIDLVLVVDRETIITCWKNAKNDRHETLNKSRFVRA